MAGLTETINYESQIYQLERTDPVDAGVSGAGVSNLQATQLANRTAYLKQELDKGAKLAGFTSVPGGSPYAVGAAKFNGGLLRVDLGPGAGDLTLPDMGVVADGGNVFISFELADTNAYDSALSQESTLTAFVGNTMVDVRAGIALDKIKVNPNDLIHLHKVNSTTIIVMRYSGKDQTPPGMVAAFAQDSAPYGWLECTGAAVDRTAYGHLFATIGTIFGDGNGTTTFNLPDLRGEFVRGWDHGKGTDTAAGAQTGAVVPGSPVLTGLDTTWLFAGMSVTGANIPALAYIVSIDSPTQVTISANATGTAPNPSQSIVFSGRQLGSPQEDMFESHDHSESTSTATVEVVTGVGDVVTKTLATVSTGSTGGVETRPRNIALMYCIKY